MKSKDERRYLFTVQQNYEFFNIHDKHFICNQNTPVLDETILPLKNFL